VHLAEKIACLITLCSWMQTDDTFFCALFKALLLALQKIKAPEEHKKFCISAPEPLLTFALSCGMYSSPAVSLDNSSNDFLYEDVAQPFFTQSNMHCSIFRCT
jgi:hypothetical protein